MTAEHAQTITTRVIASPERARQSSGIKGLLDRFTPFATTVQANTPKTQHFQRLRAIQSFIRMDCFIVALRAMAVKDSKCNFVEAPFYYLRSHYSICITAGECEKLT